MFISFTPQRRDDDLLLTLAGEVLSVNGTDFDLSIVPEGATLPVDAIDSGAFYGDVSRVNGDLYVTLILPHTANQNQAIAFPPEIVEVVHGVIVDTENNIYPWSLE